MPYAALLVAFLVLLVTRLAFSSTGWRRCAQLRSQKMKGIVFPPVSVNFHFTRQCNFECGFCFHTATTSHVEPLDRIKRGLLMLKTAGMKKINFAGGEPLLHPDLLRKMIVYCKEELGLESVSIVTNGSKLTEKFMARTAKYIDIIAVSCDSFNEQVNVQIGRGSGAHLETVQTVARLCRQHNVKFKINTVVNRYNVHEDMNEQIRALQPFRWKCFQVLIIEGENDSSSTKRDARRFCITDEEFEQFSSRHQHNKCFVPESNAVMKSSYLLLDEYMRFLNKGTGDPTESILDIGVAQALKNVYWDEQSFHQRGGLYDWSKPGAGDLGCASNLNKELSF